MFVTAGASSAIKILELVYKLGTVASFAETLY